jgi:hypothetical protein
MLKVITILKNAPAIAEGYIRSTLNIRTSIMVHREEEYCKKCPISHTEQGKYSGDCLAKNGGCGCSAKMKTSQNQVPCPLGFFANDWFKIDKFEEYMKNNPIKKQ